MSDDQADGCGNRVGLDPHVDQTRQGLRRIVGVQGRENQVARLRGLDCDLRRFQVANFADHDDVGILTEKGAQGSREGEAHFGIHIDLVDPRQVDFRRILRRRDVAILGVEDIEARIQGYGFAAAGWAGHQNHALRLGEITQIDFTLHGFIAQRIDSEHGAGRIENTRHDLFAEQRRTGADAEIDGAVLRQPHLDTAVLRHSALGDVEPGHDFEACDDLHGQLDGRQRNFLQHAVQAGANAEYLLIGLEVDVRSPFLDGIEEDFVDEAHDGRVFDVVPPQRLCVGVLIAAGDFQILEIEIVVGEARHDRFGLVDRLAHRRLQFIVFDDDEFDAHRRLKANLIERMQIGRVGDRQKQTLAAFHER